MRPTQLFLPCMSGLLCLLGSTASAGPPLLSDDPNTVEPRHLELISAVTASERGADAFLQVTAIDAAYGLLPRLELDFTLDVVASDHEKDDDGRFEHSAVPLTVAFKWEPLRSEHFSLAVAPGLSFEVDDPDRVSGNIPLLVEARAKGVRVGATGSYLPSDESRSGWVASIYGGWIAIPEVELLGEVYAGAFASRGDPELAFNLGMDLTLAPRLHLLASGGSGFYGGSGSRREFSAYLGLQLLLGPFLDAPGREPSP